MRSTIWECVVPHGKGDPTFERKLDFGKSHWAPSKFFFGRDLSPEVDKWIRIQRNVGDEFDVSLCEVDFEKWTQKQHFRAPQISEIGLAKGYGFFNISGKGTYRIAFDLTKIEEQKPGFKVEREFPDSWLVRFDGMPNNQMSLISRDGERELQKIALDSLDSGKNYRVELSKDRRWLAFFFYEELHQPAPITFGDSSKIKTEPFPLIDFSPAFFSRPGQVKCELILFDFEKNQEFRHDFYHVAKPGSGVGTLIGFGAEFSQDNAVLSFLAARDGDTESTKDEYDQISLDLKTRTISRIHFDRKKNRKRPASTATAFEVPDYLQERYESLKKNHWPEQRLALALIQQIGKFKFPVPTAWNHTRVAYSRDGKRFLLNSLQGEEAEFFFFGDLENRVVKKVTTPKELHRMPLEIYPIP